MLICVQMSHISKEMIGNQICKWKEDTKSTIYTQNWRIISEDEAAGTYIHLQWASDILKQIQTT